MEKCNLSVNEMNYIDQKNHQRTMTFKVKKKKNEIESF